jgi:hypothetical protein
MREPGNLWVVLIAVCVILITLMIVWAVSRPPL